MGESSRGKARGVLAVLGLASFLVLSACSAEVAPKPPPPPVPAPMVAPAPPPPPAAPTTTEAPKTTEKAKAKTNHCDDPAYWNSKQSGDPSDYVAACGKWPSWVDRGDTQCLPGEKKCTAYSGPTSNRKWSPEHGYYEGRSDGPKNSKGQPCMQGRDNNDPGC